jgi:hypothetical protein
MYCLLFRIDPGSERGHGKAKTDIQNEHFFLETEVLYSEITFLITNLNHHSIWGNQEHLKEFSEIQGRT